MQKQVYNILIVDDTKENLNIVQKVLELEGYQTKAVLDGITALSK